MPQTSPAGGLSLIIHILINVLVFTYGKIVKFLRLPKKNVVSKLFSTLVNKKGDNLVRRLLSYSLAFLVLVIMGGNFVLITVRLFKLEDTRLTSKIESIIAEKYATQINYSTTNEIPVSEINYTPIDYSNAQSRIEISALENMAQKRVISLVDFMESLGIVNTSFEARAELAVQSGVISDVSEYNGSLSQNREIIKKIQEELNSHIKPE